MGRKSCRNCLFYSKGSRYCLKLGVHVIDPDQPPCSRRVRPETEALKQVAKEGGVFSSELAERALRERLSFEVEQSGAGSIALLFITVLLWLIALLILFASMRYQCNGWRCVIIFDEAFANFWLPLFIVGAWFTLLITLATIVRTYDYVNRLNMTLARILNEYSAELTRLKARLETRVYEVES